MEKQTTTLICDPCKKAGRERLAIEKVRVAFVTSGKVTETDVCKVHLNPYTRNGYRPRQQSAGRPSRSVTRQGPAARWGHLPKREPGAADITAAEARKLLGEKGPERHGLEPVAREGGRPRGFGLLYRRADVEAARKKKKAGTTKRRARRKAA